MKTRILSALIVCLIGIQANASIISSVTAISSSVTPTVETLSEGINVYHDRSPGHRMVNIPPEFNGDADVVVTSNSDKTRGDFQLEVTTDTLGILYVALDSRHRDLQPLPWMQDTSMTGLGSAFHNTGRQIDFDEGSTLDNAGDDLQEPFDLWAAIAPPGTYNFFEQNFGGGSNNYVIIADNKLIAIPEPGSVALLSIGLIGLMSRIRRRK